MVIDRAIGVSGHSPPVALAAPEGVRHGGAAARASRVGEGRSPEAYALSPARFPGNLPTDGGGRRDVFGLSTVAKRRLVARSEAFGMTVGPPERASDAKPKVVLSPAEQFREQHTVSAVVTSEVLTLAIVDEVWMGIGQQIDGCVLVRIRGETVVFECGGEEVELSVDSERLSVGDRPRGTAAHLKTQGARVDNVLD